MALTPTLRRYGRFLTLHNSLHLIGSSWELIWHLRERAHTKQNRATAKITLFALHLSFMSDGGAGENWPLLPLHPILAENDTLNNVKQR